MNNRVKRFQVSTFEIPCSIFDIPYVAVLNLVIDNDGEPGTLPGINTTAQNLDIGIALAHQRFSPTGCAGFSRSGTIKYNRLILGQLRQPGFELLPGHSAFKVMFLELIGVLISANQQCLAGHAFFPRQFRGYTNWDCHDYPLYMLSEYVLEGYGALDFGLLRSIDMDHLFFKIDVGQMTAVLLQNFDDKSQELRIGQFGHHAPKDGYRMFHVFDTGRTLYQ